MTTASPRKPVVAFDMVSHSFKERRAIRNVSLHVLPQTLHGFVGPNGAGKTTALKLICTMARLQSGDLRVFGKDVVKERHEIRMRVGFMPDHPSLYRQMTIYEYLDFYASAYGISYNDRTRVLDEVLPLIELAHRRNHLIHSLSRGMQQRVSLGRVLIHDPDLVLLDEPAAGLDPRARNDLMNILRELRRMGKTIVVSSHILSELAELCDAVTIMDRGRVKYSGPIQHLSHADCENPAYMLTLQEDKAEVEQRLSELPGVMTVERAGEVGVYRITCDAEMPDSNLLLRGALSLGIAIESFTAVRKELNQAFMDLTERGIN